MTPDQEIIADMARADEIKSAAPGSTVTADAIFLALRSGKKVTRKYHKSDRHGPPPDWFQLALTKLRGRSLTISEFLMLSGQVPATSSERIAVGAWLRASGRQPYKSHGDKRFRI